MPVADTATKWTEELFALYDQHRCVIVEHDRHALFERAERALVTAAERISALDDAQLRARAEVEADRMAEVAKQLRDQF